MAPVRRDGALSCFRGVRPSWLHLNNMDRIIDSPWVRGPSSFVVAQIGPKDKRGRSRHRLEVGADVISGSSTISSSISNNNIIARGSSSGSRGSSNNNNTTPHAMIETAAELTVWIFRHL